MLFASLYIPPLQLTGKDNIAKTNDDSAQKYLHCPPALVPKWRRCGDTSQKNVASLTIAAENATLLVTSNAVKDDVNQWHAFRSPLSYRLSSTKDATKIR